LMNFGPLAKKVIGAHVGPPKINAAVLCIMQLRLGHVTLLRADFNPTRKLSPQLGRTAP